MGKLSNKWAGGVLLVVCGCFLIDKGVHWGFERMLACMESEMLEEPDSVLVYLKGNWRWSQDFEESTAARYALMYVDALYQTNRIVDDSALNVACSYYMGQGNDDESHRLVAQLYYGISLYQKHREKEALPYLLEVYESRERLMIPGREVLLLSYLKSIYYRSGLYEEARTRLGMIDSIPIVNNKVVPGGVQAKDIAVAEMRYEQEKAKKFSYEEAKKKKEAKQHSKKAQVYQANDGEAPGKKKSRLKFGEGESVKTEKTSVVKKAGSATSAALHREISKNEDDNAAVEGAHKLEESGEGVYRLEQRSARRRKQRAFRKRSRLERQAEKQTQAAARQEQKKLKKQIQKQQIKRDYAKAKRSEQTVGTATKGTIDYIKKIGGKVTNFFKENRKVYISVVVLIGLMFLIITNVTSCSAVFF